MSRIALLLPYKIDEKNGPEVFLQLHSNGQQWRFFGGHIENGETPIAAILRETKEELGIELNPLQMGAGWAPFELISRLRISFGSVTLFPMEVDDKTVQNMRVYEGRMGKWFSVKSLPSNMSIGDKLLIKTWMLRRFVFNQAYISTWIRSPLLTVDLEEEHHIGGNVKNERFSKRASDIDVIISELLEKLNQMKAKVTFFCVADTAKKYPDLIRQIAQSGHEVASHGMSHELAATQTPTEFKENADTSKKILEHIIQQEVIGFRAPCWSWPHNHEQGERFYELLMDAGYLYDSSVIPTSIIGLSGLPAIPFKTQTGIWEFPLPVLRLPFISRNLDRLAKAGDFIPPESSWRDKSIALPYSGGFLLRCIGFRLSNFILSYHLKKKNYGMVYIHPRELSGKKSWITNLDDRYLNLFERWFVGFRNKKVKKQFFSLVSNYSGCSIREFFRSANYM